MVVKGIGAKDFDGWRKAYVACKKQGSWIFNDEYDKFFDKIKKGYNKTIGKGVSCRFENVIGFMEFTLNECQQYLKGSKNTDEKSLSSDRGKAVTKLQAETVKLIGVLKTKLKEFSDKVPAEPTTLISKISSVTKNLFGRKVSENLMVSTKSVDCIKSIVLDIPYTGTDFTSLRLYILIKGAGGMLGKLNVEHFNFKNYVLDGKMCKDKNFDTREIYRVFSAPINVSMDMVGNIQLDVYISANDWASRKALDYVELDQTNVFFGKSLI